VSLNETVALDITTQQVPYGVFKKLTEVDVKKVMGYAMHLWLEFSPPKQGQNKND